jgi:methyl-accepting chemotaxis protein
MAAEVRSMTSDLRDTSRQTGENARFSFDAAQALAAQAKKLRTDIATFLAGVRAA